MAGPRFSILPGRAATDSRMTLSILRVLAALGRHTNTEGWCFINQGRLAVELHISRQAVNTAVRKLAEWGYLQKRATRRKDGGNGVCDYRVKLDPETEEYAEALSTEGDTPLSSLEFTGDVKPEGDRPLSSLEFTTRTTPEGTTHINDSHPDLSAEFEEWWEHVIRKEGKKAAWDKYKIARRKHSAETLLDGIKRYAVHCRTSPVTETRFVKQPATWLHGEHWSDELAPKDGKPPPVAVDLPGVPIPPNTPAHKAWKAYYERLRKVGDRVADFRWTQYNLDKPMREATEYPVQNLEAAE